MDSVWRAAAIYIGLMIIMRLAGKRSLAQITTFEMIPYSRSARASPRTAASTTDSVVRPSCTLRIGAKRVSR